MRIRQIQATVIAGLLLLTLMLPLVALADGPEIINVSVPNITSTNATITWTTNTTSNSRVNYGTTTELGMYKSDASMVNNHLIILTGLTPGTQYYFEVQSTDASGTATENNGGAYYSFITLPPAVYSISLNPVSGVCGDLIEVTATVTAAGVYHVCWDSLTSANVTTTFTATMAGSRTLMFYAPEAKEGIHKVYLATDTYAKKAETNFEVFPSVKIDPDKGPVGTTVTLSGYGFAASQDIRVSFEGTVKTGKSNTVGSWNITHTIPPTPAGGYVFEVEAKEGAVWVERGGKYFTVTPKIIVDRNPGTVGQTIGVNGTGFAKNERDIQVTFDGEVRAANILADAKGSWNTVITIPPRQGGTYIIDASGTSTRARDVPDIDFIVGPGILVAPNPAYVGDTITVAGGGFRPGETGIKVTFGGQVVATVPTAGINGSWETSFVLPPSTYGGNPVSARGDITAPVTNNLTIKAKIGLSTVEGAPGDSVTLTGSGFSGNKKLTVTVGGVAAGNISTQSNGNVVISFRVPKGVTTGKQTVRVTDEGGATDSVEFTVKKKVLPTPLPTLPADESTLRSGRVTFQWQGITGSSDITYTYTLEISTTPGGSAFRSKPNIAELSYMLTKEEALPSGTYYWRVKVIDNYGNESEWSASSQFTASPIPTWVWVVVGIVVLVGLMVVAYRETKFKVAE